MIGRSPSAIEARVAGVLVLHNLDTGAYARLNASAATVWERLDEPARLAQLADALVERFGIDGGRAERDAGRVVDALLARGLASATNPA